MALDSSLGQTPQPAHDCAICRTPLSGALGALGRAAGIRRSPQNPNLCSRCDAHVQDGSIVEVAVLFADLTGFTPLTNRLGPARTHEVVDLFLRSAKQQVVDRDGFVNQFAGDEIMALFNVPISHSDFARRAVETANAIQHQMPTLSEQIGEPLHATVGVAVGHARVGRLGSDHMKDYTAIGAVVNRAARLVSLAEPGNILVDRATWQGVRDQYPNPTREHVALKGFDEPVEVVNLVAGPLPERVSTPVSAAPRVFRLGLLVSAVLGAPCAGLVMLSPLLIGAGIGAGGLATAAAIFDQSAVRLPLLLLATTAAIVNLAAIAWGRRAPGGFEPSADGVAQTLSRGRGGLVGVLVSLAAFSMVVFEFFAHRMMH